ncbi:8107_t:CDS:2, partial [Gigaspora margarita]
DSQDETYFPTTTQSQSSTYPIQQSQSSTYSQSYASQLIQSSQPIQFFQSVQSSQPVQSPQQSYQYHPQPIQQPHQYHSQPTQQSHQHQYHSQPVSQPVYEIQSSPVPVTLSSSILQEDLYFMSLNDWSYSPPFSTEPQEDYEFELHKD